MKTTTTALVLTFLTIGVLAFHIMAFTPKQQPQTEKKYSVTLSMNEWQAVVGAISQPDDFSNNQKKQVAELISRNLKEVIADTTKKK